MRYFEVGFTGTLQGMNDLQYRQLEFTAAHLFYLNDRQPPIRVHHGDADGADSQFDSFVKRFYPWVHVVPHPAGSNPLDRDKEIVMISQLLIAAPRRDKEILRSGTWATMRYAWAKGIPVIHLSRGLR